jgi:hypothetical protein
VLKLEIPSYALVEGKKIYLRIFIVSICELSRVFLFYTSGLLRRIVLEVGGPQ